MGDDAPVKVRSEWTKPSVILSGLVLGWSLISQFVLMPERLRAVEEAKRDHEERLKAVEVQMPNLTTISKSLDRIDGNVEKLTDRFNEFVEKQLERGR